MKNTLRIIINAYIGVRNTRCSSREVGGKLPYLAMVADQTYPRISVLKPINGLGIRSNFDTHSLSAKDLCSLQESTANKITGAVAFVCLLVLAAVALGV